MDPRELEAEIHRVLMPSLPSFPLRPGRTALLTIDMQYLDAHPDYGLGHKAREAGAFRLLEQYFDQVARIVPRIQQLQETSRRAGLEVVHVCIAPDTEDARECPPVTRMLGLRPSRGARETEILDELKPRGDEITLTKITSSAFLSTRLDLVLRNVGVDTLILCGVITNGCVETTARDARDLGYRVVLAGDACATWTRESHERALRFLSWTVGNVRTTEAIVAELGALAVIGTV